MRKFRLLLLLLTTVSFFVNAQQQTSTDTASVKKKVKETLQNVPVKLSISGFVMNNMYYDSRASVSASQDLIYLYPLPESLDPDGNDINNQGQLNMTAFSSRLRFSATGPELFGAKVKGYLEMDFAGYDNTNGIRLRHSFVQFNWDKSSLLVGQYWHPLFLSSYPLTLSLNTGIPYQSFNRSPQITFNYKLTDKFNIGASAVYQSSYRSTGPDGATYEYQRDAILPDLSLRLEYGDKESVIAGVIGDYKWIKPRESTTALIPSYEVDGNGDTTTVYGTYLTDEVLGSYTIAGYITAKTGKFSIQLKGELAQNGYEFIKPTGYAVATIDSTTGAETYTNLNYFSSWLYATYGKDLKVGLFVGYGKNLGTSDDIYTEIIYGRNTNLDYSYRVSPFLLYTRGPLQLGAEIEYTTAAWGTIDYTDKAKIINSETVSNMRLSLRIAYNF